MTNETPSSIPSPSIDASLNPSPAPNLTFADFGLHPDTLRALDKIGYKEPSPVQAAAIPLIQKKHDVIALAKTGSGKTAACAIPICDRVDVNSSNVQALIIVPTRELATQYAMETQRIGVMKGVKTFALYGGEDFDIQKAKLKHGVQVLVATPGRLMDFIYNRLIDLSHVETLILDEADEMLGMGFYDDLEFIIQCLIHDHQTLLFSATMPEGIRKIAKKYLKSPQEVSLLLKSEASPSTIEHRFVYCHLNDKATRLLEIIKQEDPHQALVFCQSRHQVEQVCNHLKRALHKVDFLHAGLDQNVRSSITNKFRKGNIRILVATDVASRGLDFSGVTHVFIFQLGEDPAVYVHRSGRTGRQEKSGVAISFVCDKDMRRLNNVLKLINREPIWIGPPPRKR